MNTDRLWILGAVVLMVVIAVGGWFVGISPIVAQAASADQQFATVTQSNAANQQKLALLKQQYANIGPLQASLDKLRLSIPEEADASAFLQELNNLSASSGVTIATVNIASATVYQSSSTAAAGAPATTSGSTSTPTATPAPTTTAPTTTTTPSGQFVEIPVQIIVSGSFDQVRDFVGALQLGSRLYFATTVQIGGTSTATGTLSGYIFTLQGTSDPTKTAPSDDSTPTPTPTPTGTATATATPTGTPSKKPATKPTTVPTPGVTPTQAP